MERIENFPEYKVNNRDGVLFHETKIDLLSEVIHQEPFSSGRKIVTLLDLDGVLFEYWSRYNFENNVSRLLALKKIIAGSEEFFYWSSRIKVDENSDWWNKMGPFFDNLCITKFPFITNESIGRLESFARKANKDCEVESKIGFRKMMSCFGGENEMLSIVSRTLKLNKEVVIVGSSIFDSYNVNKVAKEAAKNGLNTKNIHYFKTGHLII